MKLIQIKLHKKLNDVNPNLTSEEKTALVQGIENILEEQSPSTKLKIASVNDKSNEKLKDEIIERLERSSKLLNNFIEFIEEIYNEDFNTMVLKRELNEEIQKNNNLINKV